MPPTICLSMIVRNVERVIGNAISSAAPHIDELVITDTGSTDNTKSEILKVFPRAKIFDYNHITNPEGFLHDTEETWRDLKVPGPYSGRWMLANFGAARQFGWDRCESDYIFWIDSDDVLEGGEHLRRVAANMAENRVDSALWNYDYAHDGKGNVICKLVRERMGRRNGPAKWMQPIHEVFAPLGHAKFYSDINVRHRRAEYGISPEQNHRNLKVLVKWHDDHKTEANPDPRMIFYLAMEERFIWPESAVKHFKTYCKMSGWDEERGVAHILAGIIHENKAQLEDAFSEYAQAAMEAYFNPDPYFGAARVAYFKKDWEKCIEWTRRGFEISSKNHERRSVLMHDPMDRLYRPYVYYSAALVETCRMEEAVKACDEGLKLVPEDPHLKGNKEVAQRWLSGQKKEAMQMHGALSLKFKLDEPLEAPPMEIPSDVITTFAVQMWKQLMAGKNYVRAMQFLDSLPEIAAFDERVRNARNMTLKLLEETPASGQPLQKTVEAPPALAAPAPLNTPPNIEIASFDPGATIKSTGQSLKIVIWTGPAWEVWSPKSLIDGGIGGSETAAIWMGKELARRGHKVTLLGHHDGAEGMHDGVKYVHFQRAIDRPYDYACDVFVCSRQPWAMDYNIPFKTSFLWVHDIHVGQPSGKLGEQLFKIDKIFCLSNWHKEFFLSNYQFLDKSAVIVTKNGIDLSRFAKEPKKEGNRLIYSSSPDRGLERLLELLPDIRREIPDVQLHVYYGFENWRKMADAFGSDQEKGRVAYFQRLIEDHARRGLINYHGRVNQQELADAFLASKIWAYPTWFTETYCITAIEAQAGACVPVSTHLAALPETVSHGFLLKPPNTAPEYGTAFVRRVVKLLRDDEERERYAKAGREYAMLNHGWDRVAESWEGYFYNQLAEKAENPLPVYTE